MLIEHLVENKICENVDEIEQEEEITSSNRRLHYDSVDTSKPYWNQAVSKLELFQYHSKKFREHEARENASRISEIFRNKKSARAICEKGKENVLFVFWDPFSVISSSSPVKELKNKILNFILKILEY